MKDFGPCVSTGLGTKGYLAPEMIFVGCDMYSCATDYWALGCVAFELLNKNWDVICASFSHYPMFFESER